MKVYLSGAVVIVSLITFSVDAQNHGAWDDTSSRSLMNGLTEVRIPSTVDGKIQNARFYKAPGEISKPLIVSLHTWSGDYRQKDTLAHFCRELGYHYMHPDFRGPNHTMEAMGSDLVISDIDDAIDFALQNAHVDPDNIHVMGVSGGGHATALMYMKSKHDIRSFTAYVGIYNLVDWYYQTAGRKLKYAADISAATTGDRNVIDFQEVRKRSPFFMDTPVTKRINSVLNLYVGVHDGHNGASVPVSQTLLFYNKLVRDFEPAPARSLVPEEFIGRMVQDRSLPGWTEPGMFLNRKIIYRNHYKDVINLIVFDGGHEMPPGDVLSHVPSRSILVIGDSNGAVDGNWVGQLQTANPQYRMINTSRSGNTIGFDNLDRPELNTLKNIEAYLNAVPGRLDAVVIMLGTNDSKAVFDQRMDEIPRNLDLLLKKIKTLVSERKSETLPKIIVITPPPYATDEKLAEKYRGGAIRVEKLVKEFKNVAEKNQAGFIDAHRLLLPIFPYLSTDGVHLDSDGQAILAKMVKEYLDKTFN